ncbi:MAG: SAM-dependent methyltransferase [Flavobacteriaceae bacterium]|nr:SAM-dependent methyltransferase [Flavobacteriaceae bacterium]
MKSIIRLVLNNIPRTLLTRISILVKPLIRLYLKGNQYTDPIDGKSFRKFIPYGYNRVRKNALSPSTYSLERHRMLWLYLKNETNVFSKKIKLLHFAPEAAFHGIFKKSNNISYDTIDLNSPLAKIKADICNLPLEDNTYDFILCNHVLEHINDDIKAMSELYRVLKKGGIGIFQIPIDINRDKTFEDSSIKDPKERNKVFGQYDHVRIYGMDYYDRLRSVGFSVEQIKYADNLTKDEIKKYCLNSNEIIPVCKK